MPNSLTSTGLTTATQAELLATLTSAYQAIYGSAITLTSDSPDGQMMNIYVQAAQDILDLMVQIYNSFDPDNAIGVVLDQRVAINGLVRQGGTYSQTNVAVVCSTSVNLFGLDQPSQTTFTVSDNNNNQWQLVTSQLGSVGGTYLFQAVSSGPVVASPNTLTTQVTVLLGVTSVNNPSANTQTGISQESDAALKIRRQKSTAIQSQGYLQGLRGALLNINGIAAANVNENDTDGTVSGIPAHSIWVIIGGSASIPLGAAWNASTAYAYNQIVSSGGLNYISYAESNVNNTPGSSSQWAVYNPVAQAIYNYRNAGCGMTGSTSYVVTQIDGTAFTVLYDTVSQVTPYLKIQVGTLNGVNPPNIAAIQTYLAANYLPAINQELSINTLTSLIQAVDPNTLSLYPSNYGFCLTSGGSYLYTLPTGALNKQFQISSANVICLPIAMTYLNQPSSTYTLGSNNVISAVSATVTHGGNTLTFSSVGGLGAITYSLSGSGTVGSTTAVGRVYTVTYTSGSVGTDTLTATDTLGNTMVCTITVV